MHLHQKQNKKLEYLKFKETRRVNKTRSSYQILANKARTISKLKTKQNKTKNTER